MRDRWTDDLIAQLRLLWSEEYSTAEIGRRMNLSKNTVVGKAHRLALSPRRPSPIVRGPKGAKVPTIKRAPKITLLGAETSKRVTPRGQAWLPIKGQTLAFTGKTHKGDGRLIGGTLTIAAAEPAPAPTIAGRVSEYTYIVSGERRGAVYCDQPTVPGKSYCLPHHALCHPRAHAGMPEGFVPTVAVARMENRGTLTAKGQAWGGIEHDKQGSLT